MATTAFNHGLDSFGMNLDTNFREWMAQAINLAHCCDDEGALERTLQKSYASLKLDGQMEDM